MVFMFSTLSRGPKLVVRRLPRFLALLAFESSRPPVSESLHTLQKKKLK